jgi:hypothetical protein
MNHAIQNEEKVIKI